MGDSPEQARIGIAGDGFASVGGGQVGEEEKGVDAANNSVSQLIQLDKGETQDRLGDDNKGVGEQDAFVKKPTRYLSLDQIKVGLVGPMDKIFIARDESYIVTLRELEATRRHMIEFTQNMMCLVDDYANMTTLNLK